MKRLAFFILFELVCFNHFCQTPGFFLEALPVEQGLKNHEFNCIIQDHNGIIWIGGATGLYKHNGYDVTYVNDRRNGRSCSFGVIYKIVEDSLGLIWLLTDTGIRLYDPQKERSTLIYQHREGCFWITMHLDSNGNIWASDLAGLIKISHRKNDNTTFTKDEIFKQGPKKVFKIELFLIPSKKGSDDNIVFSINNDAKGNLWVGCAQGLFLLKNGKRKLIRLDKGLKNEKPHEIQYVREIVPNDDNSLWILDFKGLYLLTNVKKAIEGDMPDVSLLTFSLKLADKENINFLAVDRKKNFIIMVDKKIYLIKKTKKPEEISLEFIGFNTTYANDMEHRFKVNDMFEDRSGVLWITQTYNGVSKFKMKQPVFTRFEKLNIQNPNGIKIGNIYKDSLENVWILVNNKVLYKLEHDHNRITEYDPGADKIITCFAPAKTHGLWIGCNNEILEFDFKSGKFYVRAPQVSTVKNLQNIRILDILEEYNGLYIASTIGGFFYKFDNEKIYKVAYSDPNAYGHQIRMRNGEIWASGGFFGIFKIKYIPQADVLDQSPIVINKISLDADILSTYDKISSSSNAEFSLSTNSILYEDQNGLLWVGNESGIHRINLKTRESQNYILFENTDFLQVMSITSDDHNNLWLGTHNKLCRLNVTTGKVKVFEEADGVPQINYVRNSIFKDRQGRIYLGGYGGLYSFHPDSVRINHYIPPIIITRLLLFNEPVKVKSSNNAILTENVSYTKSIELKHNQNALSFEFAALDYNRPQNNKYAYKLEGYDKNWKYTDAKSRVATYTNLDPGTYVLKVKGSNNDEVWNEAGVSLDILIHKPWWSTFLALSLYVLLIICIILLYIRWRLWQLNKEKLELEKQVNIRTSQIEEQKEEIIAQKDMLEDQNEKIADQEQLKSRFFANVSHEFRTPLSLIQSPVEELLDDPRRNEKEIKKLNMIGRNVKRLNSLVNQLLDISKLDASKMKLELVESDVVNHLRAITGAFTSLAETKSIYYACKFPDYESKYWFDPDKLEKIACNLLSNAFKFTPEGGEIIFTASYKNSDDNLIDRYLEFSVKDNGPGIPAHSLEKIFDRFYQVEESLKSEGGGTGIGLSLTRDIVRLLHGDINVESVLRKGSKFTVLLPLGKTHLKESEYVLMKEKPEFIDLLLNLYTPDAETGTVEQEKSRDKNPLILIVEDNPDIRMQLADNFRKEYNIQEAIDGIAGLKRATETIPDLIITDLMMPRMDGVELCERLKNDESTSHIPIIMLTAKVTLEDKITGFLTGADDYISKPFHMAELKARVSNLIEQRKKLRERFGREVTLKPGEISITPLDEQFLNRAIEVIEKNMDDEAFGLTEFREKMNITRSTLFRKLQALTNMSPTEFIRNIRLKRAADLLTKGFGNVTQVSLEVGFNNLSYFNRSFKKLYGVSPLEYMKTTCR
jgi:signal transduction histidine kinase/DNA-binding response OmpR family regulator